MTRFGAAALIALIPSLAFAQTSGPSSAARTQPQDAHDGLATPAAHEVNVSVGYYKYAEPGSLAISIHGPKIGGEYTGTFSLGARRSWFAKANARATFGSTQYDGWCMPWLIVPFSGSPNGYALDLGDASPCSEEGEKDWYTEARGLVGKDIIGRTVAWSPEGGLGFRHLSNGLSGVPRFRTDDYLYVLAGITARMAMGAHQPLSFNVEYDHLLHGWQTTRQAALGGGDIPATPTAPAFTLVGLTDLSFDQHDGWALRASVKFQLSRAWSIEPAYVRWQVGDSALGSTTATFTVNGVTAQEELGAVEPFNVTNEFVVKVGFRWR